MLYKEVIVTSMGVTLGYVCYSYLISPDAQIFKLNIQNPPVKNVLIVIDN